MTNGANGKHRPAGKKGSRKQQAAKKAGTTAGERKGTLAAGLKSIKNG